MPITTVSARMDAELKNRAEHVLEALGISHSAAINALYSQIVLRQGLPFELRLPECHDDGPSFHDIRSATRRLAAKYGLARVTLFGSRARSDARPDSDVDLLVEKGDARGWALGGFQDELSRELGARVDVVSASAADPSFLGRIEEDEVLLYER